MKLIVGTVQPGSSLFVTTEAKKQGFCSYEVTTSIGCAVSTFSYDLPTCTSFHAS